MAIPLFNNCSRQMSADSLSSNSGVALQLSSKAAELDATEEGELEVLHEDHIDKTSRLTYYLKSNSGERLELKFNGQEPQLLSGSKIRVHGKKSGNTLTLAYSSYGGTSTTTTTTTSSTSTSNLQVLAAPLPNTIGPQPTLVILAGFQDQPTLTTNPLSGAAVTVTVASSNALVFGSGPGTVNGFFNENSYGQTAITGTTVGWYTLPLNSTMSTCDTLSIATYAKQAATAAGVNLSAYTRYVYIYPYVAACGNAGAALVGGKESWINGFFDLTTISHELGHNFGANHSHSLYCGNGSIIGNGTLFPISNNTACTHVEYGDTLDTMGSASASISPHFNAYQKERLGWLNSAGVPPITMVTTSGTYSIDPYEPTGANPKALKIFKGLDAYGYKTWYYVEFRQAIGLDSWIATVGPLGIDSGNILNGVVIHAYSDNNGGNSGYLLDMTPISLASYPLDPALTVGQSYTDANAGVTISTVSASSTGATISVTVNGGGTSPTPTPTPATANTLSASVSTDKAIYSRSSTATITASALLNGASLSGASVTFTVTKPNGSVVSQSATTGSTGKAVMSLAIGKAKNQVGTYQVKISVSSSGQSASASTSFTVQ